MLIKNIEVISGDTVKLAGMNVLQIHTAVKIRGLR